MAQLDMGNGFSIDFADIDKFKSALQDQQQQLQQILTDHEVALQAPPPGNDDYSKMWSNQAGPAVQSYRDWNRARQKDLLDLMNRLDAMKASYQQTEQHNTMRS